MTGRAVPLNVQNQSVVSSAPVPMTSLAVYSGLIEKQLYLPKNFKANLGAPEWSSSALL